eukprot:gene2469-6853_t
MVHGIERILAVLCETRETPLYRGIGAMVAKKWKTGGEFCNPPITSFTDKQS